MILPRIFSIVITTKETIQSFLPGPSFPFGLQKPPVYFRGTGTGLCMLATIEVIPVFSGKIPGTGNTDNGSILFMKIRIDI